MTKIYYDEEALINLLLNKIPEFKESVISEFRFSAYLIYGDFGIFIKDKIQESKNTELIERLFFFLNDLIENGDSKVLQMLRVATLEILSDYEETIEVSKKYLKGNALKLFLEVVAFIKG